VPATLTERLAILERELRTQPLFSALVSVAVLAVVARGFRLIGADGSGAVKAFGGGTQPTGGIMLRAGTGPTRMTMYDSTGKPLRDLAASP
jgi:hypothetical protein